jgi:hypothetical protein
MPQKVGVPIRPKITRAKHWLESCDFCDSQEGEHYCIYWSLPMKNMDMKKCEHWISKKKKSGRG